MRPLLSQQVQRGNGEDEAKTLKEWRDAASHLTMEGAKAFEARQLARIEAARQERERMAKQPVVRELKRGKA